MAVEINIHDKNEAIELAKSFADYQLPVWNMNTLINQVYDDYCLLVASNASKILGFWYLPLVKRGERLMIQSDIRLFSYTSPVIFDSSLLQRRRIMGKMIEALQKHATVINILLSPEFTDVNAAISKGCFAEWRHTHYIRRNKWEQHGTTVFDSKARNHIKRAQRDVITEFTESENDFDFFKAIKGSAESIRARAKLGRILLAEKMAFTGIARKKDDHSVCGGVFLLRSRNSMLLYHSWFERNELRGVPSLLIARAVEFAFSLPGIEVFDFEGSLLAGIDHFMSSFNGEIVPCAHLYWAEDKNVLAELVLKNLAIEGRSGD